MAVFVEAANQRGEALDHILFHGPPGLGKTTLAHIIAREMGVQIRSTSGPVVEKPGDLAAILTNLEFRDVLFIDEISMLSCKILTILEKIARLSRRNSLFFGGIQVVFLGDMYQLAPVPDTDDNINDSSSKFCFESPVWSSIFPIDNPIELKTVFRQTD